MRAPHALGSQFGSLRDNENGYPLPAATKCILKSSRSGVGSILRGIRVPHAKIEATFSVREHDLEATQQECSNSLAHGVC